MSVTVSSIIVAGGSGSRMGLDTPKQFLLLGGMPVLMRTIEAVKRSVNNCVNNFIVVLPESQIDYWRELCTQYSFGVEHRIAVGGANRFESVTSGLEMVGEADLVVVHDGVRPFVTRDMMEQVLECARTTGGAIPVVEVVDSLREIVDNSSHIVNRANYRTVQTPQAFRREVIVNSYSQPFDLSFTDDASVVERMGYEVALTRGDFRNIKITTPIDLMLANQLYEQFLNCNGDG